MTEFTNLQPRFNQDVDFLPDTDFINYLQYKFEDKATISTVLDVFEKMGQPAPESWDEYMNGSEGVLVFLNRFGIVLRIEKVNDFSTSRVMPERINDSPWILRPLASINAGNTVIEICPGCFPEQDEGQAAFLVDRLREQNIDFCDSKLPNIGRIPFKTPRFPEGASVVIDRGAALRFTENVAPVYQSLKERQKSLEEAREVWEAQVEGGTRWSE